MNENMFLGLVFVSERVCLCASASVCARAGVCKW